MRGAEELEATNQLLSIVEDIHRALYADVDSIQFNYDSEQHPHVMILYLRVLELAGSALLLMEEEHIAAARIVMRPLLSVVADLINLASDGTYHASMACTTSTESAKLIKRVIDDGRPDSSLKYLIAKHGLVEQQRCYAEELDGYRKAGAHALSDFDRFKRAELLDVYVTDYWFLSLETHNDLKVLQGHHLDTRDGFPHVVYDKPATSEEAENCVRAVGTCLFRAGTALARVFEGFPAIRINELFAPLWAWERSSSRPFNDTTNMAQDGRGPYRTQRVTAKDREAGRIRIPAIGAAATKSLFPASRTSVNVILRGRLLKKVSWDPRMGPVRERSGVLQIRATILQELVREDEVLFAAARDDSTIAID